MTTKSDVDKLINMLTSYFVQGPPVRKLPEWWTDFKQAYAQKYQPVLQKCDGDMNVDRVKTPAIVDGKPNVKIHTPIKLQINGDTHESGCISNHLQQNTVSCEALDRGSIILTDIYVYPIKSCGGMRTENWVTGSKGLLYDREWMVVTPAGVCLTQKREPRLCLIRPSIDLNSRLLILHFSGELNICYHIDTFSYTSY
jgi:molybdenum cofactor sulfurtransferase